MFCEKKVGVGGDGGRVDVRWKKKEATAKGEARSCNFFCERQKRQVRAAVPVFPPRYRSCRFHAYSSKEHSVQDGVREQT